MRTTLILAALFGGPFLICSFLICSLILIAPIVNDNRANHVYSQIEHVNAVLKTQNLNYDVLKTSNRVTHNWGSADACVYEVTRIYAFKGSDALRLGIKSDISELLLKPRALRANDGFNEIYVKLEARRLSVTISEYQPDSVWALFDKRC